MGDVVGDVVAVRTVWLWQQVKAGSAPAGLDAALQEFDMPRAIEPGPIGPAGLLPHPYSELIGERARGVLGGDVL